MVKRLATTDEDFEARFAAFLAEKREASADVDVAVRAIIADVRARGDAALIDLTRKYDGLDLATAGIRIPLQEIEAAVRTADRETIAALEFAAARIRAHHERQRPADARYTDELGAELGHRWTAVESVGLYVPGGLASYPSSVLMNAIPAVVAGVPRIAMVVPRLAGRAQSARACRGAHCRRRGDLPRRRRPGRRRAGLWHGDDAPVVKIVGPGNAYVAAAKRQVFGVVGIDLIAGPSEVLVIADKDNDPEWLAADLLAQAEHDTAAQSILMTDDAALADAVEAAVAAPAVKPPPR